jgi:hypothetical protein
MKLGELAAAATDRLLFSFDQIARTDGVHDLATKSRRRIVSLQADARTSSEAKSDFERWPGLTDLHLLIYPGDEQQTILARPRQ